MISIIVPVYNVASYLPQCLDSLVNQTYRDLEIICVNDGSKDESLKILEDYAARDARIKIISRENRGIAASRNEALEHAQGEWLMFVDSDDWVDIQTCQSAMDLAEQYQADVVMWAYAREFKNQSLPKVILPTLTVWEENISAFHRRMIGPVNEELTSPDTLDAWGTVWGKLYRTSSFKTDPIPFVDTKLIGTAEDALFNIAYMGRIKKAVYVPEPWYHYRKGESFTAFYKPELPDKWNRLYIEMKKEVMQQGLGADFQEALDNRISIGIIGLGFNVMNANFSFKRKYQKLYQLLNDSRYKQAVKNISLSKLPVHWKTFFFMAKFSLPLCLLIMFQIIILLQVVIINNKER